MSALQELQNYTFVSKYARWIEDKNRRETWKEAVDRVREMMHTKYADFGISEEINWAYDIMYKKKVLGSQRALQFGGEPILKRHAKIYNCFHRSTKFVSSNGIVSFDDLSEGQQIKVLTHNGLWKNAKVTCGSYQELISLTVSRTGCDDKTLLTTSGHEWIINNTKVKKKTEDLKIGDELLAAPDIFNEFDYDSAPPDERLYWSYGYVYGDGTKVKYSDGSYKYSMVRLCNDQIKYKYRFEELGFDTSSSMSLDGDFIAYTGKYLKTTPNPDIDEPRLIKAFVRGYLDADGELNRNYSKNIYISIQSSDLDHIEFIRNCFPIAGVYIVSETDLTGQETNFGIRPYTIRFRISNHIGGKGCSKFKVSNIEKTKLIDKVWCLEVEDDHSFILENGLATGNCTSSYCDRLRFFQECFWLLLCGSGTGFSVQKHHVSKLPTLEHEIKDKQEGLKYIIEDSIEGWANALGVLLSSYFSKPIEEFKMYKNSYVVFDYSNIRPKGSTLASGVGKAPGFEPLQNGLEKIRTLLDRCIKNGQKKLRPIDAYDIVMHSSDAVLSGGVRRSASLALFSHDDEEMAKAKTGNWYIDNPQRARSNNSALLLKDNTTFDEFQTLMESVKEFGEPGFIWSDSTEMTFNPCVTIDTKVLTTHGWIEFKDLLDTTSFEIEQDSRVIGYMQDGQEYWTVNMDMPNSNVINIASNARKTGINRDIYELELTCGRKVKATSNHHFATRYGMIELKDLTNEDEILIPISEPYISDKSSDDFKLGYLVGLIHGDGCFISKYNSCRINFWGTAEELESKISETEACVKYFVSQLDKDLLTYNQNLEPKFSCLEDKIYGSKPKWSLESTALNKYLNTKGIPSIKDNISFIHKTSKNFKAGFVSGMLYSDGHSEYNDQSKSLSMRLSSVNINTLMDIQLILQELGVFARINISRKSGKTLLPDSNRNNRHYPTQTSYRLIIGGQSNCYNLMGFASLHIKDINRIKDVIKDKETFRLTNRFSSFVKSITYIGKQDVYCLTENNRRTMIVNGITSRRCVEVGMWPVDEQTGKSGWQGCNLSTINCSSIEDEDDFYERCKAAAIIGTLQAGFTELDYLGETSCRIFEREALLGVSLTGTMEKHDLVLSEKVLRNGAKIAVDTNKEISKKIKIRQAARVTCLKPEGTSSSMLGTSSGIHPHHAKRYIRHVQANVLEAPYQHFKKINPQACEKSSWSANNTDEVIKFPVEVPDGAKLKNQLPAVEMLSVVKETQKNWVNSGKNRSLCTQEYLSHNVSNTVTVKPDEWDDVTKFIYDNRKYFAGISLIPQSGDKDYPQAPFTTVYTSREIVKEYGDAALWCSGLIELALNAFNNNLWSACDYVSMNQAKENDSQDKLLFITKMKNFAGKYFDGDIKRLTYCMKDVYNWKIYCDLYYSFKKVDYTQLLEHEDNTIGIEEISCAGGACLI